MKKILFLCIFIFLGWFICLSTASADSLVTDIDDVDEPLTMFNSLYWSGNDANGISLLEN